MGGSKRTHKELVDRLYEQDDYLDAYSRHTDLRVERDPKQAPGRMWDELGSLQFEFLVAAGLRPEHRLLDIGCGTLRGGRHFIGHLDSGRYTGIDISPKAISYGERLVADEGLSEKRPRLLVNSRKDLRFKEFEGETFDFVLAQSVFTHLMPEHIEECFEHVGAIMDRDSAFYFTFKPAAEFERAGRKDFRYPFGYFQGLAERCGFALEDRSSDYPHPRGQRMLLVRRA